MEVLSGAFWTHGDQTMVFHLPRRQDQLRHGADGVSGSLDSSHEYVGGGEQILGATAPVYLTSNQTLTATDFGKINNLCTGCHQIRGVTSERYTDSLGVVKTFDQLPFFPFPATKNDNAPVNYQVGQSFSVHDGNQSNLFKGVNGYEYSGQTYSRVWQHSANSCTTCHMNKYDAAAKEDAGGQGEELRRAGKGSS